MSRIYFHTPSSEAEVRGAERAYLGLFTQRASFGMLRGIVIDPRDMRAVVNPASPAHLAVSEHHIDDRQLELCLNTLGSGSPAFVVDGTPVAHWELLLNTVELLGSDHLRLAARIHAQCEIHAHVEGPDREWLADLIEAARRDQVFRADMGWESVVAMLRARDDEPVVMSYSVCDSFPNEWATTWQPDADDPDRERWGELSVEEQWSTGMDWLRTNRPRLCPAVWGDYRYGHNLSAVDLVRAARGLREATR